MLNRPTTCTRNPGRWAFSMIEVMVAVAILATVMTILASNLYTLNNVRINMKERAVAREIARLMSERIQSENFSQLGTSNTTLGWSWHRRLTPIPGSAVAVNPPLTEDAALPENNLINQGLLQQRSEIRDLSVFLEYYRNTTLMQAMVTAADPATTWREISNSTGTYASSHAFILPETNPLGGSANDPFIMMRIIVRWSAHIGGTQQLELVVAKKQ